MNFVDTELRRLTELAHRYFHPDSEVLVEPLPLTPHENELTSVWIARVHCGLNSVTVTRVGKFQATRTLSLILENWNSSW